MFELRGRRDQIHKGIIAPLFSNTVRTPQCKHCLGNSPSTSNQSTIKLQSTFDRTSIKCQPSFKVPSKLRSNSLNTQFIFHPKSNQFNQQSPYRNLDPLVHGFQPGGVLLRSANRLEYIEKVI